MPRPGQPRAPRIPWLLRACKFRQRGTRIGIAQPAQARLGLGEPRLRDQPTRAVRNRQQQGREQHRRQCGHGEFVAPHVRAGDESGDAKITAIGEQDADHDVDLEQTHECTAPIRRRDFREIHRRQHRGSADGDTGEESTRTNEVSSTQERTQCGEHVQHADDAQHIATAVSIAGPADDERAEECAPQRTRNRRTETGRRERKEFAQRSRDSGDDGRVEAE